VKANSQSGTTGTAFRRAAVPGLAIAKVAAETHVGGIFAISGTGKTTIGVMVATGS
jgi:hypothetical protein